MIGRLVGARSVQLGAPVNLMAASHASIKPKDMHFKTSVHASSPIALMEATVRYQRTAAGLIED